MSGNSFIFIFKMGGKTCYYEWMELKLRACFRFYKVMQIFY